MKKETSAGGVVMVGNAILLLRKYNGDWVLPKGRTKPGEELPETALREVLEETGVKGEIINYIGNITYTLNGRSSNREKSQKTVHWYYMKARNMDCTPQRSEGFVEAKYVHIKRAIQLARYDDERKIIVQAEEIYENVHQDAEKKQPQNERRKAESDQQRNERRKVESDQQQNVRRKAEREQPQNERRKSESEQRQIARRKSEKAHRLNAHQKIDK